MCAALWTTSTDRRSAADYAEAGIADYWIIDLQDGVRLDTVRLVGGRYEPELVA